MTYIDVKNLSLNFGSEQVLKNISFQVEKGQKVAITGESGAGKSSLFNILLGFIPHFGGHISIAGNTLNAQNMAQIRQITALVPQNFNFDFTSVRQSILFPFTYEANKSNKPDDEAIGALMHTFGLHKSTLNKRFSEISGGQRQRVLTIAALLQKKQILFLDEPSSALDAESKIKLMDYLFSDSNSLTILAVTHDMDWEKASDFTLKL